MTLIVVIGWLVLALLAQALAWKVVVAASAMGLWLAIVVFVITPCCAQSSARVHSRYQRTIRDLPCAGRAVLLRIQVRRFRCDHAACPQRILTERLDPAIPAGARRTGRLTAHLQRLALVLASAAAAPLLAACGMPTSPSTPLRLQRRVPLPEPAAPYGVNLRRARI